MPVQQTFVGGNVRLKANGAVIGWARQVGFTEEYSQEAVEVLDKLEVAEHATTGYRCSATFGFLRVPGNSLRALGLQPGAGATSAELRTAILSQPEFTLEIENSTTGELIAKLSRCKISNTNFSVDARGLVGHNVSINAIRLSEEVDGI